ncbi:hypothetical protein [Falsirhodobacter halotolerans]|uniref:hypothetical protein n=1 Tax=Falsirhodobacter halotolerans TaxID=1146892 RepID=UPI001FD23002|nr:hypothetical protein [Falsirhodobacter halotolerans]MCJ8138591.1 hypothetical protein [Falsirhodobacter halotolerans]
MTERYGNRRVVTMYAEINELRRAIRAHDSEATEAAWDKVEAHIDYAYGHPTPSREEP